jgi:D-alanine transaminase
LIDALTGSPLEVEEQDVSVEMFSRATEIWLTSSTRDLVPVTSCDGRAIGDGKTGPVYLEAVALYATFKSAYLAAERERSNGFA